MLNDIKVSVICLAYNHEKYIRQTLDGFVAQKTNFKFEVFVHDDASTDSTAEIIKEYAQTYDFIKPILQTDNQYSKNINVSRSFILPRIQGQYITYCEGDDYWTNENKLQIQADYLDQNPDCSMCCHAFHKIRAVDNTVLSIVETLPCEGDITPEQAIVYKRPSQLATQMFRAEVLKQMPPEFYGVGVSDYPMLLRAVSCGRIHYFNQDMAAYRVASEGSWTSRVYRDTNRQLEHWENIQAFLLRFDQYSQGRFHSAIQKKLDLITFSCAILRYDYKQARRCKAFGDMPIYRKTLIILGCFMPSVVQALEKSIDRMRGK